MPKISAKWAKCHHIAPCKNTRLDYIVPACPSSKHQCSSGNIASANTSGTIRTMAAALVRLKFQHGPDLVADRSRLLNVNFCVGFGSCSFASRARWSGAHAHGAVGTMTAAAGRGGELCGSGLGGCGCGCGGRRDDGVGGAHAHGAIGTMPAASCRGRVERRGGLGGYN